MHYPILNQKIANDIFMTGLFDKLSVNVHLCLKSGQNAGGAIPFWQMIYHKE